MNSLRDLMGADVGLSSDGAQARLEDYLDYLCAPLLGIVPYAHRRRLRVETADHLIALIEDFTAEGFPPDEAVTVALREYGEPWQVGQNFADAWLGGAVSRRMTRVTDGATLRAFGWFGVFTVLNLLSIEWYALASSQDWVLPLIQCLAVVSPILAGTLTGMSLDSRTGLSICRAVCFLGLISFVTGLLLRPHDEGLTFAVFQFVFWLPVGCFTATVAATLRRQSQCRRFRSPER